MGFNIDGFNERNNYIRNSNNVRQQPHHFDNSFAKMRSEERRNMVETTNNEQTIYVNQTQGKRDNFIVKNMALNNFNHQDTNNPVRDALNRNMFKK